MSLTTRAAHYKRSDILKSALKEMHMTTGDLNFGQIVDVSGRKYIVTVIEQDREVE